MLYDKHQKCLNNIAKMSDEYKIPLVFSSTRQKKVFHKDED